MLPELVVTLLRYIREGSPYPDAWLGTQDEGGGGRVRTVRLEELELESGRFLIASDVRHRKRLELSAEPRAELCLVRFDGPVQVRIRARLSAVADPTERQRIWSRQRPRVRRRLWSVPEDQEIPPEVFLLLRGDPLELDAVDLRPEIPQRFGYLREPDGWTEERRPI